MSCGCNFRRNEDDCITNAGFSYMVLMALKSLGGKASRQQVLFKIKSMFGDHFHQPDKDKLEKNCDGAKKQLLEQGVLQPPNKGYGIWALTEDGRNTLDKRLADLIRTAWVSE